MAVGVLGEFRKCCFLMVSLQRENFKQTQCHDGRSAKDTQYYVLTPWRKHHHHHHPPSHLTMLCSVCHFSQTLSCLTFGETKEPQERREGGQRMRGGTAQVDSFRISAAHNGRDTFTVMKAIKNKTAKTLLVTSIIGDVYSGTVKINLGPKSKQLIQLKIKKGPSFHSFLFFFLISL